MIIASPVGVIKVINDEVVENTISESNVLVLNYSKLIILPSDINYQVVIEGYDYGSVTIYDINRVNEETMLSHVELSVSPTTTLSFNLSNNTLINSIDVDDDGDGVTDYVTTPSRYKLPKTPPIMVPVGGQLLIEQKDLRNDHELTDLIIAILVIVLNCFAAYILSRSIHS